MNISKNFPFGSLKNSLCGQKSVSEVLGTPHWLCFKEKVETQSVRESFKAIQL